MIMNALLVLSGVPLGALIVLGLQRPHKNASQVPSHERLLPLFCEQLPIAFLVFADAGEIRFANRHAEELLFGGKSLHQENFQQLLNAAPVEVRSALLSSKDVLFSLEHDGESQSFQLIRRVFRIDDELHVLLVIHQLTREFSRREVAVLKKVIRVMSHELNNSLASMSSLIGSGRRSSVDPKRLARVFTGLEERTEHLKGFLGQYAEVARLPKPRLSEVRLAPLLEGIQQLFPEIRLQPISVDTGWFDVSQVEQALINLAKNAFESGGNAKDVELMVRERNGELHLGVLDRGDGFSDEALAQGLLPFYSTKAGGSGMGLALCREIAEGHGGRLHVKRREGGGSLVYCVLPFRDDNAKALTQNALTLTRV